jgi:hypothetical protein
MDGRGERFRQGDLILSGHAKTSAVGEGVFKGVKL